MKVRRILAAIACTFLFSGGMLTPSLGTADDSYFSREEWESMSEEERAAKQEERRAKWESMSEEERAAKREEKRAKWEAMSYKEQAAQTRRYKGQKGTHVR